MNKKLTVSVGLLSALCFFAGYYNWLAAIILMVAVLALSGDIVLKKNAVSATVFSAVFSVILTILSWISRQYLNILSLIENTFYKNWDDVYNVTRVFRTYFDGADLIWEILRVVFFIMTIIFVFKALKGDVVKVPFVSKLVEKHVRDDAE